jgi:hypothetical protein
VTYDHSAAEKRPTLLLNLLNSPYLEVVIVDFRLTPDCKCDAIATLRLGPWLIAKVQIRTGRHERYTWLPSVAVKHAWDGALRIVPTLRFTDGNLKRIFDPAVLAAVYQYMAGGGR